MWEAAMWDEAGGRVSMSSSGGKLMVGYGWGCRIVVVHGVRCWAVPDCLRWVGDGGGEMSKGRGAGGEEWGRVRMG